MHFKLVWVKIAALKQCHQRGQLLAILGWIIYIPLQILFVPISIVGGLVAAYKQVWASKKFGVSSTATKVLEGRLHMHWFGLREDQATDKLSKALPNFSFGFFPDPPGLRFVLVLKPKSTPSTEKLLQGNPICTYAYLLPKFSLIIRCTAEGRRMSWVRWVPRRSDHLDQKRGLRDVSLRASIARTEILLR